MRWRPKPIEDQVVVVMGASSGIGRLTALELARRGATVVVAARGQEPLESVVTSIRQAGWKAVSVVADTTIEEDVARVTAAAEELGGVDTWVQVAGVSIYASLEDTTADELRQVVSVGLIGPALAAKAAVPAMKRKGGGQFICISSVEAEVPVPLSGAYVAAKHGVAGLLTSLRMELEHERAPVAITNVMPYAIDTPFFDHARTRLGVRPRPVPPAYDPQRVVGTIVSVMKRPRAAVVVGGAGRLMVSMHRHFPRLADALVGAFGVRAQRSRVPKQAQEANNLMAPVNDDRVRGTEAGAANARIQRRRRVGWMATAALGLGTVAAVGIVIRRGMVGAR
jgi:short-subunit dehydrogenase